MSKWVCLALILVLGWATTAWAQVDSAYLLPAVPDGFNLQVCDDCGVVERQSHVQADCGVHTFSRREVNAPLKVRTVACGLRKITARYDGVAAEQRYVLAVTYANEAFNARSQSLWAGGIQLHGAHALPKGNSERLVFAVPPEAIRGGALELEFRLEAAVNVVVSAIELYATLPSPERLYTEQTSGLNEDLRGAVLDLAYEPVAGAEVAVTRASGGGVLAKVQTGDDGAFVVTRAELAGGDAITDVQLVATRGAARAELSIPRSALVFEPIRYRPIPAAVQGLQEHRIKLDGRWHICTQAPDAARRQSLKAAEWGEFKVPGQWLQQGYDVPVDKPVAVASELQVPAAWKGYRIFLRFDAIHAGTHYWLNGKDLGYSENLYTPVEWDITDAVQTGATNRLDLLMKLQTVSENLSYSSGYAFHSLGGIDRSVWIYALPPAHLRTLRAVVDLDRDYRDGLVTIDADVERAQGDATALELVASVRDGHRAEIQRAVAPVTGPAVHLELRASNPRKWSDEKPNLYTLTLELKRGADTLERVERQIGFRKIEIRNRQLYVNNRRVKLAGVCRHETDPLTGRADTMHHAEEDLKLVKEANLNYVRTSHYPPPVEVLDAADRLGLYLEVEAPFCWVQGNEGDIRQAPQILAPTSAMVDFCHTHPSVLIWSVANESRFFRFFALSNAMIKELDPTRPTTFNNPDPDHVCDIANVHYPPMPFDSVAADDPRPMLLGEYFFPVCHEQTDVRIDPGLRELYGAGHRNPDSAYGRECARVFEHPPAMIPGGRPDMWPHMYQSERVIGGAIWALLDEPFYLPGGKHAGYYWVHGPWGLIDTWRRPKPEWWLAKRIFTPVWIPTEQAEWSPGQTPISVLVHNRYAFTNLDELTITWELGDRQGRCQADVMPGSTGTLVIPLPADAKATDVVTIRVTDSTGRLVNIVPLRLGPMPHEVIPQPVAGAPTLEEPAGEAVIAGEAYRLVLDTTSGELKSGAAQQQTALLSRPRLHLTRYDWGDFIPDAPRYEVLPQTQPHEVEAVRISKQADSVRIEIREKYALFAGTLLWTIDRDGVCAVTTDYVYTGPDMHAREVGIRMALRPECQTLTWRRWSEWGVYPEDSISRTQGTAQAHRDAKWPLVPENVRPSWPWALDENEFGTADFRGVKLNIYSAALTDDAGHGVSAHADADAHVVARLAGTDAVWFHVLSHCRLGPVTIKNGDRIGGTFHLKLQ